MRRRRRAQRAHSGEAVKLVLVPGQGPEPDGRSGQAYCEQNLTGYKRPRVIEFPDSLPKTPVGKILPPRAARRLIRRPGAGNSPCQG